jgi:predicted PurR-regulated permease PerM
VGSIESEQANAVGIGKPNQIVKTKIKAGREFSAYRVRDSMGNSETEESPLFGKPVEGRKLIELAYLIVILAVFALAKEFLLPLILAILISFLLAPAVSRLERWSFPGVIAILSVVGIAFALIAGLCSTLSIQGLDLVNSLPKYQANIHDRWVAIQHGPPGPLSLAFSNVDAMIADLGKVSASAGVTEKQEATKVQIVSGAEGVVAIVKNSLTPVMGPIAEFAVVVVLVVFMLLERKQIRVRFLRLIGHSRAVTTTLAIDEAGSRLSGFLLGQLLVNTAYALVLGLGLFLIGIPNALLWAVLTLVLRFLPYVGLWISAFFPLALSIAISTSWKEPLLTLALYGFLEVFTNNFVEPFVLGGSTGMSPLAIIVSALFWTWLWGSDRFVARDAADRLPGSAGSLFSRIPYLQCFASRQASDLRGNKIHSPSYRRSSSGGQGAAAGIGRDATFSRYCRRIDFARSSSDRKRPLSWRS